MRISVEKGHFTALADETSFTLVKKLSGPEEVKQKGKTREVLEGTLGRTETESRPIPNKQTLMYSTVTLM